MRRRLLAAGLSVVLGGSAATAQFPSRNPATQPGTQTGTQPGFPSQPMQPGSPFVPPARPNMGMGMPIGSNPGNLPIAPSTPYSPTSTPPAAGIVPANFSTALAREVLLPFPEEKFALNAADVTVKRVVGGWQLWAGQRLLKDFGNNENDAKDTLRVFRDIRPTEWVTIGGIKPIVEYGLVNGQPPTTAGNPTTGSGAGGSKTVTDAASNNRPVVTAAGARTVVPIDLNSVRVEPIKGVWCLRDETNILFNFGPNRQYADQTLAVVRKYGFNRIGVVGAQTTAMSYFFVSLESEQVGKAQVPPQQAALMGFNAQVEALNRTGVPVPGLGFVGEMVKFDPRKIETRKEANEWVVAVGTEILGHFGPTEWAAREAMRTLQEARYTEVCRVGSAGLTFFLVNGKTPTKVPFTANTRRFDLATLKVQLIAERWAITEGGRHLFDAASQEEGEAIIRVLKHFGFDQVCQLGPTVRCGITFLAKCR